MGSLKLGCDVWREVIVSTVFDELGTPELIGLEAHLEGCADCRELSKELVATHAALAYADPAAMRDTWDVPADLSATVLSQLHFRGQSARRRRVAQVFASVAATLLLVGAVATALLYGNTLDAPRSQALYGEPGVTAVVQLSPQPWGTSLAFHEVGQVGHGLYTVSMRTTSGRWWVAGTYRAVAGGTVNARMACAVAAQRIDGIRVTSVTGAVVLDSGGYTSRAHLVARG